MQSRKWRLSEQNDHRGKLYFILGGNTEPLRVSFCFSDHHFPTSKGHYYSMCFRSSLMFKCPFIASLTYRINPFCFCVGDIPGHVQGFLLTLYSRVIPGKPGEPPVVLLRANSGLLCARQRPYPLYYLSPPYYLSGP